MNYLERVALSHLGVPYIWGGKNPMTGFDCSGFVEWCLESVGYDLPGQFNAQALRNHFIAAGVESKPCMGALVFFGDSLTKITHVGLLLNSVLMVEAGGGDSRCTTLDYAKTKGACVRIRPYQRRKDVVSIVLPQYPDWLLKSFSQEI